MREATFDLCVKSGGWTHHPKRWHEPDARMVSFSLIAVRDGQPLGGHNVQAHVEAPESGRPRASAEDADARLPSGWLVWFRNEFARAPEVATQILASVETELSEATSQLDAARGGRMAELNDELFARTFHAKGPNFWR